MKAEMETAAPSGPVPGCADALFPCGPAGTGAAMVTNMWEELYKAALSGTAAEGRVHLSEFRPGGGRRAGNISTGLAERVRRGGSGNFKPAAGLAVPALKKSADRRLPAEYSGGPIYPGIAPRRQPSSRSRALRILRNELFLSRLPPEEQLVFRLRFLEGLHRRGDQ